MKLTTLVQIHGLNAVELCHQTFYKKVFPLKQRPKSHFCITNNEQKYSGPAADSERVRKCIYDVVWEYHFLFFKKKKIALQIPNRNYCFKFWSCGCIAFVREPHWKTCFPDRSADFAPLKIYLINSVSSQPREKPASDNESLCCLGKSVMNGETGASSKRVKTNCILSIR